MSDQATYESLLNARGAVESAKLLSDTDLRNVLGFLARGEASGWVADMVRGVCIVEASERFLTMRQEGTQ